MAFEAVAFKYLVHHRKTRTGGDEANDDLRLLGFVVLGESRFLKVVFLEGFEVERGDILQHQAEVLFQIIPGCLDGGRFDFLLILKEPRQHAIGCSFDVGDVEVAQQ